MTRQRQRFTISRQEAERLYHDLDVRVRQIGIWASYPPAQTWEIEAHQRLARELGKDAER